MQPDKHSSRSRIRSAAKTLFADKGYEATTIADITRAAKTSHSQFLKYYAGKETLRREIIEQQWSELTRAMILAIPSVPSASGKLTLALNMFISFLEADPEFRAILLLEQAATRDQEGVAINAEFRKFVLLVEQIMNAMKEDGELSPHVNAQALRSALVASVEGMMRDQMLAGRGFPAQYSVEQVREVLAMFVATACQVQRPNLEPREMVRGRSPEEEWIRYYLKLGDEVLSPSELS